MAMLHELNLQLSSQQSLAPNLDFSIICAFTGKTANVVYEYTPCVLSTVVFVMTILQLSNEWLEEAVRHTQYAMV